MAEVSTKPVRAICNICQVTTIDLGERLFADESIGEIWDVMTPLLVEKNWAVRSAPSGGREAICPGCVETLRKRKSDTLPPFEPEQVCPKCASGNLKNVYCRSRSPDCTFVVDREHMHRTCLDCGYSMITDVSHPDDPGRVIAFFWIAVVAIVIAYFLWKGHHV